MNQHFLIIRFSSIGDIILSTPIVAQLKLTYPNCKISFLTYKNFTSLLTGIKFIDQVIGVEKGNGLKGLVHIIRTVKEFHQKSQFSIIIDHHSSLRSFFVSMSLFKLPKIVMNKKRFTREILLKLKMNFLKNDLPHALRHISEWQGLLHYQFDQKKLAQFIGINDEVITLSPIKKNLNPQKMVIFLPGASFQAKRWPIHYFSELIEKFLKDKDLIEFQVTVLAGKEDEFCQELSELKNKYPDRFFNLQGQTNLLESMEIINNSQLVVGNDTGLIHAAESLGIKVISFMGPTHESFGFRPYLSYSHVMSKNLWCRPCSATGSKKCFRKQQYCFMMIKPLDVLLKIKQIL
jgi:heptosyltransferase-2